jgi:Putative zinc-finger
VSPGSCRWAKKRLHAFAGGDLPARAAARLRLHLRECQACRGEASGWLQARKALVDGALCGLPASVDEAFFDRLHRQVLAEVAAESERSEVARVRTPAWWRLAAAAVLLIGAGWWSVQLLAPDNDLRHRPALPAGGSQSFAGPGLRPLAEQEWSTETDSDGQGLMGRIKLRTLELDTEPAQANKRRAGPAANPQDRR